MIKKILSILIIVAILIATFLVLSKPPKNLDTYYENPDLVFYWGEGCPHCETVKEWLEANNQQNQIKISSKEVYDNQSNAKEFVDTINQYCPDLKGESGIGVPTAFDPKSQTCLQGSDQIIKFLTDKLTL